ncbi:MAG: tryptophan-rich sensory protein [Pseudanabaena sp. SU_2_4]|nr:tryptophan-rich sensory protein [Pseudanabaena sp. SU_2_4]
MKISTPRSRSGIWLPIATLFAIFGTLVTNSLSNFFPPGGLSVAQIANTILKGVLITPANYAFSIWGVIYIGLIAYSIYQFLPAQRRNPTLQRVNLLLIAACIAQIAWIYLFTLRFFDLSIMAMLAILLPLIQAYLLLGIGRVRVKQSQKWLVHIPFSIYLAWISVATIVNVASALYIAQWQGWGISTAGWTVIMLIVATWIGAIAALQRSDLAFVLVYIWAFVAIAIRQSSILPIVITAVAGATAIAALGGFRLISRNSKSI